jgi:hypothetical protein
VWLVYEGVGVQFQRQPSQPLLVQVADHLWDGGGELTKTLGDRPCIKPLLYLEARDQRVGELI